MSEFIHDDFLLSTPWAQELYHNSAKDCAIIDYHNHLSPSDIASDRSYQSITELWLEGDHYKWRAMRACGVDERFITGDADDFERFEAYAKCVPQLLRNPLYHWTHLELKRYFGIDELLNGANARKIYDAANQQIKSPAFSAQGLLSQMNVELICTTDDPTDDLAHHQSFADQRHEMQMLPTFRPDKSLLIQSEGFKDYIVRLGLTAGIEINHFGDVVDALMTRIGYFHDNGCRLSDHGLSQMPYGSFSRKAADKALAEALRGEEIDKKHAEDYMFTLMQLLCREYARRGWVQQFHLGAMRNNNNRMLSALGPDTGWDSIGDYKQGSRLSYFMNALDNQQLLAKTILYNLNPADNALMAAMVGNFNDGAIAGKIQYGSGWWFMDQLDGMRDQINALSNIGVLSQFVGMLTDSRSLLSFPRHEYFRRLLCQMLGDDIEQGLLPQDMELIGGMVKNICYNNAKAYFNL